MCSGSAKRLYVHNIVSCYLIINMPRVDSTISSIMLSLHPLSNWLQFLHFFPLTQLFLEMGDPSPPWWGSPTNSSGRPSFATPQRSPGAWHERHRLARHCTRPHPRPQGFRGFAVQLVQVFGGCEWWRSDPPGWPQEKHLVEKNASTFFGVEHFVSLSDSTKKKKKNFAVSKAIISR